MHRYRAVRVGAAAFLALALTGCGGSEDNDEPADTVESAIAEPSATDAPGSESVAEPEPESEPAGDADCSVLTDDDVGQYLIATQLLAQVTTADQVASIREMTVGNYDSEAFAAALVKLRSLVGGSNSEIYGNADDALDSWEQANTQMAAMIAATDPTPQDMLDSYIALGDVGTKLGWQLPINAPLNELCPDLQA